MKIDKTFIIPLKHFSILWIESEFVRTPQKTSPYVLGMFGGAEEWWKRQLLVLSVSLLVLSVETNF